MEIDPQLLLQRLITAGVNSGELQPIFKYELCSYPPGLFQSKELFLQAYTASLATALWKLLPQNTVEVPDDVRYVVNGGPPLHRVPWEQGTQTYLEINQKYVQYVAKKYGPSTIVFDGYLSALCTKENMHLVHKGDYF